ncbi:MAG: DUF3891 family protein [Burkholderiales bacterium]|nr:DUF3891 family protein [Phycisphaerae bacterium]
MIRRHEGNAFWLINQHDHALAAGNLAAHIGNAQFAKPQPADTTLLAVAQHDAGWHPVDERCLISIAGLPLDVFAAPRAVAHEAWLGSAKAVSATDPYAGLLVSLHQLALSATSVSANQPSRFDVQQLRQQFDLNKFQHAMIELAEGLRGTLGLTLDRPLRLGLADGWTDEPESRLAHNFRLLQAMDVLSLAICCTEPPAIKTGALHARPGSAPIQLNIHRPSREVLLVKPWPFDIEALTVDVPYRPVPNRVYTSAADLARALEESAPSSFTVTVRPC